jgi:RecA/RadA recombinase
MTPVKKAAPKKEEEKKKSASVNPRDMSAKERREAFLAMKKANAKSDDWRVVRSDVEEERIPFGLISLDHALQLGGLPRRGRVLQFHGQEHGGKSTLCCKIIANYQAATGEPAVIFDHEGTLSWKYLQAIGVDPDLAELYTPDAIPSACVKTLEHMEAGVRLFMFDSIPAMKNKVDAKDIKSGKAFKADMAVHARGMSKFFDVMIPYAKQFDCTFLMVNQVRDRFDPGAENAQKYPSFTNLPYTLPGGRAARYLMSAMIEVNVKRAYKEGKGFTPKDASSVDDFVLGPALPEAKQGDFKFTEIAVRILKNKMSGGGYRGGTIWMRPGLGIDDNISVRQLAREYDLISMSGKKWVVGEAATPIASYNNKAEAIEDLVVNGNPEVMAKLKKLTADYIDRDKSDRFMAEGVDENTAQYLDGQKDFYGGETDEDEIVVKNVNVDTDDEL